nr:methyltransferase domain-containing protein [uncultured Pseudomonas sp.]
MARLAQIKTGDDVLEPSAGNGNLADAAKAAGANVDVIELSPQLQDILQPKGYNLVATDFETFTPSKQYDAIVINPPFSNRKDAAHTMRAFTMLKPDGRLVAIAGEGVFFGSDKAAVAFREWLEANGAQVEGLAAKTFMDTKLLAITVANARRIVLTR